MPKKICYVVCNPKPEYVRTAFISKALEQSSDCCLFIAKNDTKSIFRYLQTLWRLFFVAVIHRPDVYLLGFRGYELFFLVRILAGRKPLVFDEFINAWEYFSREHRKIKPDSIFGQILYHHLRWQVQSSQLVLCDTKAHGESSAVDYGVSFAKYFTLYVGTDEDLFVPDFVIGRDKEKKEEKRFEVFFYGTMLPLHGVEYIINAADKLINYTDIHITIAGTATNAKYKQKIDTLINSISRSNLSYLPWIEYHKLPEIIAMADLTLGGPFGGTYQAKKVITGKTFQFLSMGKPVVVGIIEEDCGFIDGKNCFLVSQASAEGLAKVILRAYSQSNQLSNIGKQGRFLYESKFSVSAQKKALIERILEIC